MYVVVRIYSRRVASICGDVVAFVSSLAKTKLSNHHFLSCWVHNLRFLHLLPTALIACGRVYLYPYSINYTQSKCASVTLPEPLPNDMLIKLVGQRYVQYVLTFQLLSSDALPFSCFYSTRYMCSRDRSRVASA